MLTSAKRFPQPADYFSADFHAEVAADLCDACGVCESRCQMDALGAVDGDGKMQERRVGGCRGVTRMGRALSETYARDPKFYGATFCVNCNKHLPVAEFVWTADGQQVGS